MSKITIPTLHKKQMDDIDEKLASLTVLEKELTDLKATVEPSKTVLNQIEDLTGKISTIKNARMKYLLKNADLLYRFNDHEQHKKKTIYNIDSLRNTAANLIQDPVSDKMSYYHKYRANVEEDYVYVQESHTNEENYCYNCKVYMILKPEEAYMICEKCGMKTEQSAINEKQVVKDQTDNRFYEYKRFAHFSDWLDNLQGKENVNVDEVIDVIHREVKRERKNEKNEDLTEEDIRRYLKKYKKDGFDRYYDHATQILFRVTEIKPVQMSAAQEQNLKLMFLQIQEPFELYKLDRTNFSSYGYIIYKFCQLLGYKEFLPKLKLHKNYAKLYEHDMIWKKICTYLGGAEKGWAFIKSYEY